MKWVEVEVRLKLYLNLYLSNSSGLRSTLSKICLAEGNTGNSDNDNK